MTLFDRNIDQIGNDQRWQAWLRFIMYIFPSVFESFHGFTYAEFIVISLGQIHATYLIICRWVFTAETFLLYRSNERNSGGGLINWFNIWTCTTDESGVVRRTICNWRYAHARFNAGATFNSLQRDSNLTFRKTLVFFYSVN